MSANASPSDNVLPARQVQVVSNGHRSIMSSGSLNAQSTISLAMMREAFKGLLADTEMSFSSAAEQRDVLERSRGHVSHFEGGPIGVRREASLHPAVIDCEENRDAAKPQERRVTPPTQANLSGVELRAASD
ncbi:MAG: hypothetical protein ACYDB2_03635 [Acidimicrobiales bacterium]